MDEPSTKKSRLEEDRISISSESEVSVVIPDGSDDEIEEVREEFDVEEVEVIPEPEIDESSEKADGDSRGTTDYTVTVEDSVDTTDTCQNNRKRKLSEPSEKASIYEAKTQVPLNTSTETIDDAKSPVSMEVAYDASKVDSKVVIIEKLDDDNLPSTNETDDVQITCGQNVVISQEPEPNKDTIEVEVEISTVATDEIEENEKTEENEDTIATNENNIEVKITSKEISVEDMLADFVDEVVNDESSLVTSSS